MSDVNTNGGQFLPSGILCIVFCAIFVIVGLLMYNQKPSDNSEYNMSTTGRVADVTEDRFIDAEGRAVVTYNLEVEYTVSGNVYKVNTSTKSKTDKNDIIRIYYNSVSPDKARCFNDGTGLSSGGMAFACFGGCIGVLGMYFILRWVGMRRGRTEKKDMDAEKIV